MLEQQDKAELIGMFHMILSVYFFNVFYGVYSDNLPNCKLQL
jgi:hypothetical protein